MAAGAVRRTYFGESAGMRHEGGGYGDCSSEAGKSVACLAGPGNVPDTQSASVKARTAPIHDISKTGAALDISDLNGKIPAAFNLIMPGEGLKLSCRVVWRGAFRIGVAFRLSVGLWLISPALDASVPPGTLPGFFVGPPVHAAGPLVNRPTLP